MYAMVTLCISLTVKGNWFLICGAFTVQKKTPGIRVSNFLLINSQSVEPKPVQVTCQVTCIWQKMVTLVLVSASFYDLLCSS